MTTQVPLSLTAEDLRKTASALKQLGEHEKRAEATRLLFEQVERGFVAPPRTVHELETKVAGLMERDLKVVAEAMKLASASTGNAEFGTLEDGPAGSTANTAEQVFFNAFMEV